MVTLLSGLVGGLVATIAVTMVMMALGDDSPPPAAALWAKFVDERTRDLGGEIVTGEMVVIAIGSRTLEDVEHITSLHDLPGVHHDHSVGDLRDDAEVVSN